MPQYLDPKADIVFKKIFGDHPHLLISFLNAVLPLEADELIVELSHLPTEQVPEIPEFRRTIADVKCKDCKGRIFIVELQMNWTDTPSELTIYQSYWDGVSREKTLMIDKYTEGKVEGEEIATHRIAKSMLKCGVSIENVMEYTQLSHEEVDRIQKN